MTKRKIKYFLVLLVVAILLAVPVLAYSNIEYRASEQLTSYSMNAKATGNGKIAISFSVDGTGKMTRIGAKKIIVYQQIGGTWALANSSR